MNKQKGRDVVVLFVLLAVLWTAPTMGGSVQVAAQDLAGSRAAAAPSDLQGDDVVAEYRPGHLLVKFRAGVSAAVALGIQTGSDAVRARSLEGDGVELWSIPEGSELALAERLNSDPRVEFAEPDYRYHAFGVPDDPDLNKQWGHTTIKSAAAWDIATGSSDITIAILDSGIDLGHPDLAGKIVPGHDFVDGGEPWDTNGHGTHVAGIAAAATNNGIGIAGMDWNARIMPVRVLDDEGSGWTSDIASGVYWAYQNGAKVINMSLGGPGESQTLQAAVESAHAAGSLVVASMGNCRTLSLPECPITNPTNYPAAYDTVVAVAATTRADGYAYYSQYGTHCDIAAPGGEMQFFPTNGIYSSLPSYDGFYLRTTYGYDKNYDYLQGTSMAAPYVAGLAALLWSVDTGMSPDKVRSAIESTADDLGPAGWDPDFGHGRINALSALQAAAPPDEPTLHAIYNPDGDGTYLVEWTKVSNALSYSLQEDDNPAFSSPTDLYSGTENEFMVTGRNGGTWYYRVRAVNSVGPGPWSNAQSIAVKPVTPTLSPPENPGNADTYVVGWSLSSGAVGYTLEEADEPSFSNPKTRYEGPALAYTVSGQWGGNWYYRVRAYNSAGESAWSNTQSTTVSPTTMEPPNLHEISNSDGDGDYAVRWTVVLSATSYVLEESSDPFFSDPDAVYSGPLQEFSIVNQPGGIWYYRVRALGTDVRSPWSSQQATKVFALVYLPLLPRNHRISEPGSGIVNGDFESGHVGWGESSSHGWPIIADEGFPATISPRSGTWAAWLGGGNNETSYIEQQVTVPHDRSFLVYWHWIASEDICGSFGFHYDFATVLIDATAEDLYDLCDLEDTGGWGRHAVDLSAYQGQSVDLRIQVETDSSFNSNLFVDDVSFQATASAGLKDAPAVRESGLRTEGTAQTKTNQR